MITRRIVALAACLPLAVTALTGASSPNAAMTYHGTIVQGVHVAGDCPIGEYTGVWNAVIPDPEASVAVVHLNLFLDGKRHATWKFPFTLTSASAEAFDGTFIPPWFPDDFTRVRLEDSTFTYDLDSVALGCSMSFSGPRAN